jgi:hypothetical protein
MEVFILKSSTINGGPGYTEDAGTAYQSFRLKYNPSMITEPNSSQAKRKKHASRHDPDTVRKHAAQIFAEMLGQVCHKEFYENSLTKNQEVSLLPSSP